MATYDELFPHGDPNLKEPFAPIRPRALAGMGASLGAAARRAIPAEGGDPELASFEARLNELMGETAPTAAPSGTRWTDPLKNLAAGTVEVGAMGLGALEYGSRQLLGNEQDAPLTGVLAAGRRGLTGVAEDITQSMAPEAQDLLMRQMDTLDPQRTVWQNPVDALRSIGYKFGRSIPSTLATLLPAARLFKAGMSPGAVTYLGASEGGLSLGGIANNIAQEIEGMSDEELQAESPRFVQLLQETGNPQAARQGLIEEAQGVAPVVGGVTVGLISAVAGRYLEPVFSGAGSGIAGRFGRGFAAEAPQEAAQSGVEQYVQNIAAQVYDADRSGGEGLAGAALEGGVIGGLTGGGFSAVFGQRRQAIPPETPPAETPPVDPDVEAALKNSPLMEDEPPQQTMAYGQGEMFGPPPGQQDIEPFRASLQDRFGYDPTRDAALTIDTDTPYAAPAGEPLAFGGTDPAGFALQQDQFQFTYPETAPPTGTAVAPPPEGIQYPLGLREPERVAGRGRAIITPQPVQGVAPPDMSAPPEFSNERLPVDVMPANRRPTRADFIRADQEQKRRERYEGTVRDENQLDMFDNTSGEPPPPPPPGGSTAAQEPFGFIVRGVDDSGQTVYEEIFPTREEADADLDRNTLNEQGEIKQQPFAFSIEPVRSGPRSPVAPPVAADQASAEPPSDIMAQVRDLADPQHWRKGVYLSRDNVAQLRELGVLDQARAIGVPLMNFDLRGGTLIAKDRKTADAALTMRKQGVPMQEILGIATGAGRGKPADNRGKWVAQQRDESGAVTRETLTETEEEAQQLADQFEQEPGRTATVVRVDVAIKRRERLAKQEAGELKGRKREQETRRAATAALLSVGDLPAAEEARSRLPKTESRDTAARSIAASAQGAEVDRVLKRSGGFDDPDSIRFTSRSKPRTQVVAPPADAKEATKARFGRMLDYWKQERAKLRERKREMKKADAEWKAERKKEGVKPKKGERSPAYAAYAIERARFKARHDKWAKKYLRNQTPLEAKAERTKQDAAINERYRNAYERRQEALQRSSEALAAMRKEQQRLDILKSKPLKTQEALKTQADKLEQARKAYRSAEAEIDSVEQELAAFYRVYRARTTATDLAEAAKRVSRAGARKEMDAPGSKVEVPPNAGERPLPDMTALTPEEIDALSPGRIDTEFLKAAAFMSALRPARKRDLERRGVALAEGSPPVETSESWLEDSYEQKGTAARNFGDQSEILVTAGRTIESYVEQYTRRSEKLKLIRRAQQLLAVKGQPKGRVRKKIGGKVLNLSPLFEVYASTEERDASPETRAKLTEKVQKSITALRAAVAKTNTTVEQTKTGPYAQLVEDHVALMNRPLEKKKGETAEEFKARLEARDSALRSTGRALYGRMHLRNLRRIALSLLRSRNRTQAAGKLADQLTELLSEVAGISADSPAGARALASKLSTLSGMSSARFKPGKGVATFKQAFEQFLDGKPTAMQVYLRSLSSDQIDTLLTQRTGVGPHPAKVQAAVDSIQEAHSRWVEVAQGHYESHVRPVMLGLSKNSRALSKEGIERVRKGIERMRSLNMPLETVRALRRLNPADPRLPENFAPTMDLIVEPLIGRLKQLGFLFDENGNVSGWRPVEITQQEASERADAAARAEAEKPQADLLVEQKPVEQKPDKRAALIEKYDAAVAKLSDAIDAAVAPTQIADAEDRFFETLRRIGAWKDDGISDLLPPTARSYNDRVGPRLRRKQLTLEQAASLLRERYKMQGAVEVRAKVVSEVTPVSSFSAHESPMRPDITSDMFRKLPPEEQRRIREARLEELRRRRNLSVEARRELERLDRSVMPDPTRPDIDAAAFRRLPPDERAAIRRARLDARRRGDARDMLVDPNYGQPNEADWKTHDSLKRYFDNSDSTQVYGVLDRMARSLPANHMYQPLIKLLRSVQPIQGLAINLDPSMNGKGFFAYEGLEGEPSAIWVNMEHLYDPSNPRDLFHTLLHEITHAATSAELINGDPRVQEAWRSLQKLTVARLKNSTSVGQMNLREFVAEVFTNPELQEAMRNVRVDGSRGSLWARFVRAVRSLFSEMASHDTLFDYAIALQPVTFSGRPVTARMQQLARAREGDARAFMPAVADLIDSLPVGKSIRDRVTSAALSTKEGSNSALLGAMTLDQINYFYGKYFEKGDKSWLNQWHDAFAKRNSDNAKNMEVVDQISRDWTALEEAHQNDGQTQEFSRIMTEATRHGVWPNLPITDPKNKHIKSAERRAKHAELRARYNKLPSEWHALWDRLTSYYNSSLETEQNLAVLNALRAYLTTGRGSSMEPEEFTRRFKEGSVKELKLNTKKGLRALFNDEQLSDSAVANIVRMGSVVGMWEGPYFPMSRFGKYVVYAEKIKEVKTFGSKQAAREYAAQLAESDPTLDFKYDDTTLTVSEIEYRQAETRFEAGQDEQEMVAKYGRDAVSPVQLKETLFTAKSTIAGPQGLKSILDSLGDNAAAKAAIKDFYLRSLGENSFRKHERRRKNRRGVDDEIQHRAFAAYSKAAAYYTSQLRYGWRLAEAKAGLSEAAKAHRDQSEISAIRMQQIAQEIRLRDEMTTDPDDVPKFTRKTSEISQFMLLTTASYWMINASQPWMVTLPWLGAKFTAPKAAAALLKAQQMIASPLVTQAIESRAGLKALFSKVAAEKAFTVLEQVEEHLDKNLGVVKAKPYRDMLTELRRLSIIDLSFVAELRDIAEGVDSGRWRKVLDASRIMAHLTEVNNRIATAIAAYDLAMAREGMTHDEAVRFAGEAVSQTQFNYSGSNAPRLFQHGGPLGVAGPLLFQFMKYPQHIYALMVGNMLKAVKGSSPQIRREALRILLGVSATHLAVGGVVGWTLQPLKWVVGMLIMALNDDDDRWQDVASGELYDRTTREWLNDALGNGLGRAVGAGIPAALGTDLSSRMALGSLYFIDFRPENAESFLGSALMSFGGPALSLTVSAAKSPEHFLNGDYLKAIEAISPKFVKDLSKTIRFATEGMTDSQGASIIDAEKFSPVELFLQGAGFQPTRTSEAYAGRQALNVRREVGKEARQRLIRRYLNADTPEARQRVMGEIAEFSRSAENPITRSDIVKAMRRRAEGEERTRIYGANLRGREVLYADEYAPYEME